MHIKRRNFFSKWDFIAIDPSGQELKIPRNGYAKSREELVEMVFSQLKQFDAATNGEYLKKARKSAGDMDLKAYLAKVVEHQVCLRVGREFCYDDGFGDTMHGLAVRIDNWVDGLGVGKKAAIAAVQVATFLATGKKQRKLGGCSRCGGTRKFSSDANNLGRAGTLNKLTKN